MNRVREEEEHLVTNILPHVEHYLHVDLISRPPRLRRQTTTMACRRRVQIHTGTRMHALWKAATNCERRTFNVEVCCRTVPSISQELRLRRTAPYTEHGGGPVYEYGWESRQAN